MADQSTPQTGPTITIDGQELGYEPGQTVIQIAKEAGIDVPHYCYHPGLSIAGNCRICMVEVEGWGGKPQISCKLEPSDGMVVHTQSELAKIESRRESATCPNVRSGGLSKKDERLRWKGARFTMDPVHTSDYAVKSMPENRHVRITLIDPRTEVLLSFENPACDPYSGFRSVAEGGQDPMVVVFQPPPQAGYCGRLSVSSRPLEQREPTVRG